MSQQQFDEILKAIMELKKNLLPMPKLSIEEIAKLVTNKENESWKQSLEI